MDLIDLNTKGTVVAVTSEDNKPKYKTLLAKVENKTIVTPDELLRLEQLSQNTILLDLPEDLITSSLLTQLLRLCQPGGQIILNGIKSIENVGFSLKISGFVDVKNTEQGAIKASKPKYEIGSSAKLKLKQPTATVWKLDGDSDEEETIDPDNLLDDDDLKKPDPESLRVCGTTGKRKACKDCSCGLADELANEVKSGKVIDTGNDPKSSCGSCYLGDAFRCASCPYLGMPAFKPGEKIQLSDNLLKADI